MRPGDRLHARCGCRLDRADHAPALVSRRAALAVCLGRQHRARGPPRRVQDDGAYRLQKFDTGPYCRRIFHYELTEKNPVVPPVNSKDLVIIDLHGSDDFIRQQQPVLKALGARVRSHPTSAATISIRESEGIAKSFQKHLNGFTPKFGTEKAVLARMAQERLGV
jgi:hypothetical protein